MLLLCIAHLNLKSQAALKVFSNVFQVVDDIYKYLLCIHVGMSNKIGLLVSSTGYSSENRVIALNPPLWNHCLYVTNGPIEARKWKWCDLWQTVVSIVAYM